MLRAGEQVPHFDVETLDGTRAIYASIWQHRNLVLVSLPQAPSPRDSDYAAALAASLAGDDALDTACVFTRDEVPGVPRPGAIVADRWGEIQFAAAAGTVDALPDPAEIADWVRHVRSRCPECEGEAR